MNRHKANGVNALGCRGELSKIAVIAQLEEPSYPIEKSRNGQALLRGVDSYLVCPTGQGFSFHQRLAVTLR